MVTYRVHQKQLSDTLHAQFIYENSPVFAGTDDFSLLVRLRYTGDISELDLGGQLCDPFHTDGRLEENAEDVKVHTERTEKKDVKREESASSTSSTSQGGGWFGSRLSTQLSSATRSLLLQTLNDKKDEDSMGQEPLLQAEKKQRKETLFLGYAQVLGHYLINDSIIDFSIFQELLKSTIIEGKYAGIQGLNAIENPEDNLGMLPGLSALYNTEINSLGGTGIDEHMQFIPFYSSNQNIIFSDCVFDPEQWSHETKATDSVRSFYINCKLPKDLPPTYFTEAVQINYNFIFGYQMMEGNSVVSKTVFVPLKIGPFIDKYGRQPIYHLEKARLNTHLEDLVIEDVSKHPAISRHNSSTRNDSIRRVSFWNLKKNMLGSHPHHMDYLSSNNLVSKKKYSMSISSLSSVPVLDDDVKTFLDILDKLDSAGVNDIMSVQEQFERKMNESKQFQFNVRENLMQILADYKYVQRQTIARKDIDEHLDYDYILPKEQQIKYIIKQNHGIISTVTLNKGIFKLGDQININLSFDSCRYETTGIELQLLKHQYFNHAEYLKKSSYGQVSPRLDNDTLETILFEKVMSLYGCTTVNTDILVPLETEPQFKTNFFVSKYYIQIKFITIDAYGNDQSVAEPSEKPESEVSTETPVSTRSVYDMKDIFTDGMGSILFRSKDYLYNANEFYIRIPVVILPTYEQDFGVFTAKV